MTTIGTRPGRAAAPLLAAGILLAVLTACTTAGSPPTAIEPPGVGSTAAITTPMTPAATTEAALRTSTVPPPTSTRPTTPPPSTHPRPTTHPVPRTTPNAGTSILTIVRTTVTRTKPATTITVHADPPRPTPQPAAVDGNCPYLSADVVSDITGQHHGQTQLVQFSPHPMCIFYRSDGGRMGSVRVIQAASAAAAIAAVDQQVPVSGSQPAAQPAGWVGGSVSTPGQMTQDSSASSVYAVSRGSIAVVAQEDESPSIKARVMAVCAIYGLGLQSGVAPDYCSGPQG